MVKQTFASGLLDRLPPLAEVDTSCARSDWATCVVVDRALQTYGGLLRIDFEPDLVETTKDVAAARVDWQTLEGVFAPTVGLAEVQTHREVAATDETGAIRRWDPLRDRLTNVMRTVIQFRRALPNGRLEHERELLLRQQAEELKAHRATPAPEFKDDARLVIAAALTCQAVLGRPQLRLEAAEVLVSDFGETVATLARVGSVAIPGMIDQPE